MHSPKLFAFVCILTVAVSLAQTLPEAVNSILKTSDKPTKPPLGAILSNVGTQVDEALCELTGSFCGPPPTPPSSTTPGFPPSKPPPSPGLPEPSLAPVSPMHIPSPSPGPGPAVELGRKLVFPATLAFNSDSNDVPNGIPLFPISATLLPYKSIGRRLLQAEDAFFPYMTGVDSKTNATISIFKIPIRLFSLNANRTGSTAKASYAIGPNMLDERVINLANALTVKCPPPLGSSQQAALQDSLSRILSTNDLAIAFSPQAISDYNSLGNLADGCAVTPPSPAMVTSSAPPPTMEFTADTFNISADPILNAGLGEDTGPVSVTGLLNEPAQYAFASDITILSIGDISGCLAHTAELGYGGTLLLCMTVQLETPAPMLNISSIPQQDLSSLPSNSNLLGRRLLQDSGGMPQKCVVELKIRAFIPTQIVYAPCPFNPIKSEPLLGVWGAFIGNNRDFSYDGGDSKAEIQGTFTIVDDDFSDLLSITPSNPVGIFGPSKRYRLSDTTRLQSPIWGGVLNSPNAIPLQQDNLGRTTSNLFLQGILSSGGGGSITAEIHAGLPLVTGAQPIDANLAANFFAVESSDGNGYTYYFELTGIHDGFPAYEIYVNQVLAYSYSPLGSAFGPAGLFFENQPVETGFQKIPGCPQPIMCNTTNMPLVVSGGQSPTTDTRIIPATGVSAFVLDYNAYTIPDRFYLFNPVDGTILFDAGYVGTPGTCDNIPDLVVSGPGQGSYTLIVPKGLKQLGIAVDSPCVNTLWVYTITCTNAK